MSRIYIAGDIDRWTDEIQGDWAERNPYFVAENALRDLGWDTVNPAKIGMSVLEPEEMEYYFATPGEMEALDEAENRKKERVDKIVSRINDFLQRLMSQCDAVWVLQTGSTSLVDYINSSDGKEFIQQAWSYGLTIYYGSSSQYPDPPDAG